MRRRVRFAMVCATLLGTVCVSVAQPPAARTVEVAAWAPASAATPSSLLRPALDRVSASLAGLSADRWKLSKELRAATDADIDSIRRDLDQTLPALLTAADASPDTLSAQLAAASNVGALYDVLLRVTERAKLAAPAPIPDQLIATQIGLEGARRSFTERITETAAAQDRRDSQLQAAQAARPAAAPAPTSPSAKPCTPAPPKPKRKATVKPVAAATSPA